MLLGTNPKVLGTSQVLERLMDLLGGEVMSLHQIMTPGSGMRTNPVMSMDILLLLHSPIM